MSAHREKVNINTSSSKQQFAFSKQNRFATPRSNTHAFGYEIKGQFGHKNGANTGKGFYTSQTRFPTHTHFNSSVKLDGPSPIDKNGRNFGTTTKYSFGVSRDSMKKLYVDEILKAPVQSVTPGPDKYDHENSFGQQKG